MQCKIGNMPMKTVEQLLESKGRELWTIPGEASVLKALHMMADKGIGALLVVRGGRLLGIFSERDYARNVVLKGRSSQETTVGELMVQDVISVSLTDTLENCLALMTDSQIRHLPVLDTGKPVGMLTLGDVVKQVVPDLQRRVRELETSFSND
jgi:CBS domain-containing protein